MTNCRDGEERRLVLRMLEYWRDVCGDRDLPSPGSIDPKDIAEFWPHCFLLDLETEGTAPSFGYVGGEFQACSGTPLTGLSLSQIPGDALAEHATFFFEEVLRKGAPVTRGGVFADARGATMLYRSILLPMSKDGRRIDGFLGAANCREVALAQSPLAHGDADLRLEPLTV